jgi:hypothetical protein
MEKQKITTKQESGFPQGSLRLNEALQNEIKGENFIRNQTR